MTKTEVMRDFIRKTVLPVVVALLLFSIFRSHHYKVWVGDRY